MDTPIFGVEVPAPPVHIPRELLREYANLYTGIRNRFDTVTWRTLVVTVKKLLGVDEPDYKSIKSGKYASAKKLLTSLTKKTYLAPLLPELYYAVGVKSKFSEHKSLDFLLLNGKHNPEPLLWTLADYISAKGKSVAVVNPVGHYNDGQTRVVGLTKVFHHIEKLVILSSTQSRSGGSVSVLSNVIRLIRNPEFVSKVKEVHVVIPMFGGSRGHRLGQSEEVGYEVMEAAFNAKLLSLPTKDLIKKVGLEGVKKLPQVKFYSIDIHSNEYPAKTFNQEGFEFNSIIPSEELASGIGEIIRSKKIGNIPLKVVACDKGAVPRTERLAEKIISSLKGVKGKKELEVIYFEKRRVAAGVVSGISIEKIERWKKVGEKIIRNKTRVPDHPSFKQCVIVYSDDMIDTGGTAEKDLSFIEKIYPNTLAKIFVATHPIFSKGLGALKRINADFYVIGNTLHTEGVEDHKEVITIDMAPAIYKSLL